RATGLSVQIENPARACALSQMWTENNKAGSKLKSDNFVYVSISDGVGVGIVVGGELVRGAENKAGEFGHIPLNLEGPRCLCGALGCWEAYVSNLATLSRYFGHDMTKNGPDPSELFLRKDFTVNEVISRAYDGDTKAIEAIETTAKYLGLGLANVIKALNPGFVYIGGEITAAWDMIEATVRTGLSERALTDEAVDIPIRIVRSTEYPRLRGAAALLAFPAFAAPRVA
ncbi:MAG: ROK family protein, partial [Pyrinomonadaceae bacterium]